MNNVYNRYIPQSDGSFQRNRINDQRSKPANQNQDAAQHHRTCQVESVVPPAAPPSYSNTSVAGFLKQLLPKNFDTGDLLIVLLLLLMAGDNEEEKSNALLTLALYFFL